MKNILLVWELGCGLGQITRLLTIGRALKNSGHNVIFAVRHLHHNHIGKMMHDQGFEWFQAPFNIGTLQVTTPRFNSYTHVIQNSSGLGLNLLLSQVKAWRHLYHEIKPDKIIFDNSPTAIIAAHGLDVARIVIGNHYNIPPTQYPLPSMKRWIQISDQQLKHDEDTVVCVMNSVFKITDQPAVNSIKDLYSLNEKMYLTFKEFDYYNNGFAETKYLGVLQPVYDELPHWNPGDGKRIFIYLQPWGFVPTILKFLQKMNCRVLALISNYWQPGISDQIENFNRKNIKIGYKQYSITHVVQECDLVICHSGHDTVCHTLLGGKPLILIPNNLDKNLTAKKVEEMGAGLLMDPTKSFDGFRDNVEKVLMDSSYTRNANKFAEKYQAFSYKDNLQKIISAIEKH